MARRRASFSRASGSADEETATAAVPEAVEATNGDAGDPEPAEPPTSIPRHSAANGDQEPEPEASDAEDRTSVGKRVMNWLGYGLESDEALAGQRPPALADDERDESATMEVEEVPEPESLAAVASQVDRETTAEFEAQSESEPAPELQAEPEPE